MNPSVLSPQRTNLDSPSTIVVAKPGNKARRKNLLFCGIFSSLLYICMNIWVPMLYKGYSSVSQTVNELSAIGAPTRSVWGILGLAYGLLLTAFGFGIWQSAFGHWKLYTLGGLFVCYGVIGFFWPPMHQREVLAIGGGTLTDILHLAFLSLWGFVTILTIGFGAATFGTSFRNYSVATIVALLVFAGLTVRDVSNLQENLATPLVGIWQRIDIAIFLTWVVVLAIVLLRAERNKA